MAKSYTKESTLSTPYFNLQVSISRKDIFNIFLHVTSLQMHSLILLRLLTCFSSVFLVLELQSERTTRLADRLAVDPLGPFIMKQKNAG